MEAPHRPEDGLLGPAGVDRKRAASHHTPRHWGWWKAGRFGAAGGGGALCGGPGCGLGVAVGVSARGARGALVVRWSCARGPTPHLSGRRLGAHS